jgi:hypothetical protein
MLRILPWSPTFVSGKVTLGENVAAGAKTLEIETLNTGETIDAKSAPRPSAMSAGKSRAPPLALMLLAEIAAFISPSFTASVAPSPNSTPRFSAVADTERLMSKSGTVMKKPVPSAFTPKETVSAKLPAMFTGVEATLNPAAVKAVARSNCFETDLSTVNCHSNSFVAL